MIVFTIGNKEAYVLNQTLKDDYVKQGIGFGDVAIKKPLAYFDHMRNELQVTDRPDDYEKEICEVGYALYEGIKKGVEQVSVVLYPDIAEEFEDDPSWLE